MTRLAIYLGNESTFMTKEQIIEFLKREQERLAKERYEEDVEYLQHLLDVIEGRKEE